MLHPSKRQSILQWFNALTTNVDVNSLSQFADGSLFCDIVTSVYSQAEIENPVPTFALTDCSVRDESSAEVSTIDKSALIEEETDTDGNASTSAEQIDVVQKDDEASSAKNDVEENVTKESSNLIEIKNKYEIIEKFIDAFFQIKSSNLIIYSECIQGKDMELAKVAVMLLSAMVQNFLSSFNEALHTITLLEASVQEDIKECLSLVLERDDKEGPLTKAELLKVLGRATKYKATPRRKTPHRGNPEPADAPKSLKKRRGERVSTIIYEDMQESPLKGLLQSPNNSQHRIAIAMFKKETELSKLRNAFHAEEMRVEDLTLDKRNLSAELEKKKEELEHLRLEFRQHCKTTEEREGHANMERANYYVEMDRLRKLTSKQSDEIKSLKTENDMLENTVSALEEKLEAKNTPQDPGDRDLVANVMKQINEVQQENLSKDSELQECKKKIETLDEDIKAYKQMYEELLNKRESPMVTPTRTAEVVSNIYKDDAMEKFNEKEREVEKLKKLILNLKNQLKEIMLQEKTDNMKAVLDKLSSLQEKYENLVNKAKCCPTCGTGPESEDLEVSSDGSAFNSSSPFGKLWGDAASRENVPHTRSRTSTGVCTSLLLNPITFERLKTLCRNFCKLIIKFKVVDDQETMQQIDAQTRRLSSVEDFAKTFERILFVLKRAIPTESFAAEMTALRESVQDDKPDQELQKLKENFCKMKEKLTSKLADKESELKAAQREIQNLKTVQDSEKEAVLQMKKRHAEKNAEDEKEILKLKSEIAIWEKKYNNMYQVADKFKSDRNKLKALVISLQEAMEARDSKVEPCTKCEKLREKLLKAKKELKDATQKEERYNFFRKDYENKIKSYEKQVQNLMQEKKQLQLKIQHHSANLLGSTTARNALIRKYFQLGNEEERRKEEDQENKRNALEVEEKPHPIVNVNTYFLHPERINSNNETSMSNHFGNRSIKSAYLQTEDEEDFLNHSSLAQIQNSAYHSPPPEDRLLELQRRNTFCPPHLQSSYPLELQDMTPSERKYSMAPRFSEAERGYQGMGEGTSNATLVKKRKVSETDITQPIPKRMVIGSSGISMKPRTPVRQGIGKSRVFKTPSSIRRLINMQGRKNKMQ